MEQSAALIADNLFNFAMDQYQSCEEGIEDFGEITPEDHFHALLIKLDDFLDVCENSEYVEDMEDQLAAIVGCCLGIAVSANLFTEPIDPEEEC